MPWDYPGIGYGIITVYICQLTILSSPSEVFVNLFHHLSAAPLKPRQHGAPERLLVSVGYASSHSSSYLLWKTLWEKL